MSILSFSDQSELTIIIAARARACWLGGGTVDGRKNQTIILFLYGMLYVFIWLFICLFICMYVKKLYIYINIHIGNSMF